MSHSQPESMPPGANRREFAKKSLATVLTAILGIPPLLAGLMTFLDPLRRKTNHQNFLPVIPLSDLPADGSPQLCKILDNQVDAWNFTSNVPIGTIYLRRLNDTQVEALNATCPHLGCMVEPTAEGSFHCPCHNSRFTAKGEIVSTGGPVPSPRAMDSLEVKIATINNVNMVTVQYKNFKANVSQKIPA